MKIMLGLAFALTVAAPAIARADVHIVDSAVEQTIDCTKDPVAQIDGSSAKLTFTGPCTSIMLNGSSIEATIESVLTLAVMGSSNNATVVAANKIMVTGSSNHVTYKKSVTPKKKTKVGNTGSANSIKKVK